MIDPSNSSIIWPCGLRSSMPKMNSSPPRLGRVVNIAAIRIDTSIGRSSTSIVLIPALPYVYCATLDDFNVVAQDRPSDPHESA